MAKAIDTQRKRSNIQCQENIAEKYNGIDVDNLYYSKRHNRKGKKLSKIESKRKLGKYLTKYVSKNQTTMHRLPWHCSRDISALFDKQLFNKEEINEIIELSKTNPGAFVKYEKEHYTIYLPKFDYMLSQYTDIKTINDMLLDIYFQEAPPE
jgi:hypothetical protein